MKDEMITAMKSVATIINELSESLEYVSETKKATIIFNNLVGLSVYMFGVLPKFYKNDIGKIDVDSIEM